MPLSPDEAVDWGAFERDNADCLARSWTNAPMRNVQLVWAIMCGMQAAYTITKYPRMSWEEFFIPAAEVLLYGLQAGGVAYVQQFDGRVIPWVRYMGWIVMFPVLLGQVNRVHSYRILGFNANTMLIGFGVLAFVFQISADACGANQGQQWMFLFFAFVCYCFVYRIVWKILSRRWDEFDREGSEAAQVALKLRLLAATFFTSWMVFPVLKMLGPQTLCIADENLVSSCHLIADLFAFNVFVGLYWNILWQELDGDWSVESLKSRIANQLQNQAEVANISTDVADNTSFNLQTTPPHAENESFGQGLTNMKASQMRSNLDSRMVEAPGGAMPSPGASHVLGTSLSLNPYLAESPETGEVNSRSARRELLAMMEGTLQRQQMYLSQGNVSADVGYRPPQGNFMARASELAG